MYSEKFTKAIEMLQKEFALERSINEKLCQDKDGNPIWESTCHIAEKDESFSAKSSSKKDAKKSAAFKMLQYVLRD